MGLFRFDYSNSHDKQNGDLCLRRTVFPSRACKTAGRQNETARKQYRRAEEGEARAEEGEANGRR